MKILSVAEEPVNEGTFFDPQLMTRQARQKISGVM
jgi:hypothetical protein